MIQTKAFGTIFVTTGIIGFHLSSRANFAKQATNLWVVKQQIQTRLVYQLDGFLDNVHLVDGFPMPVCEFARANYSHVYISQFFKDELQIFENIQLETPKRRNMKDDRSPSLVKSLMSTRRYVETIIGQSRCRFHIEKVRAHDFWHLTNRITRKK